MKREPIYDALLLQLQQLQSAPYVTTWPTIQVSLGFKTYEDAQIQPALFLVPMKEHATYVRGLPTKWMLHAELWIYVRSDSINLGVQNLNALLDAVDSILSPLGTNAGPLGDNGYVDVLGGLVQYVAIQGEVEISGGYLQNNQTVARVPLEILVA